MKRSAFTLIELLVVIAIIAILAAILFPVFAQAKASAKVSGSLSSIKQLGLAVIMYGNDNNDMTVYEYGSAPYTSTDTWVGRVEPYVKSRSLFWDNLKGEPRGDDFADPFYPGDRYKWQWTTTYSLNTDGFSHSYGGTCESVNWNVESPVRSMTSISEPSARLMIAPVRYANLSYGWMRFFARDASWPYIDEYAKSWSWSQLIWDSRREYPSAKMVGAFADGSARKFGKEKFVAYSRLDPKLTEAKNIAEYCKVMQARDLVKFWGPTWAPE